MKLFDALKNRAYYVVETSEGEKAINYMRPYVAITNIQTQEGKLLLECRFSSRKKAEKMINDVGGVIISKKYTGFTHTVLKYRHRCGLAAGLLIAVFLVVASSFFVWEVRVEGNESVADYEIVRELAEIGFHTGVTKKSVDIDKCVNMLLVKDDRISWAAINFDGSVAHVEIKEAKIGKRTEVKDNVNLVASHDGIIIRVDALDGNAEVKKGDTVFKGQLLVSAFMPKRTGGSILTGARGYVWANTERCYSVAVPLEYREKAYSGKQKRKYTLTFLGVNFVINNFNGDSFDDFDITVDESKVNVSENIYLPIDVKCEKTREYTVKNKRRTEKAALDIAKKTALERLNESSPGFKLAFVKENSSIEENVLIYNCVFNGVENIAEPLEFDIS